jgi:hypothetical protein
MFGKIVDGRLKIAGNTIKTENGFITNPNAELLRSLGYKEVQYTEKPEYDKENEKLSEVYTDGEQITVSYEKVSLSPAEHNAIIKQEIVEEEKKITDRNYREAIKDLKAKKETSYALDKIDEIENNIAELRSKLVEEPKEEDNDGNIN